MLRAVDLIMPTIKIKEDTEKLLKDIMVIKIEEKLKKSNKKKAILQIANKKFGISYDEVIKELLKK